MRLTKLLVLTSAMVVASPLMAGLAIYPSKGQSPEQQKQDEAACYSWAVQQTGSDPAKPASENKAAAPEKQASGPSGSRLRGAARGAIVGEITNVDTRDAAVAGAVIGASRERRVKQAQAQQAQAAEQQKKQATMEAFNKAQAACLEGKGYTVK
jgi:hypothetical protein